MVITYWDMRECSEFYCYSRYGVKHCYKTDLAAQALFFPPCKALALEAGHASAHDLVHKEQVAGDHRAGVDHLPFDAVGVVDPDRGG